MTDDTNVLLVTVDDDPNPYVAGLEAIQRLGDGKSIDEPATVRFPNESRLTEVFNERTYTLIRVIRDETPESIRETARFVGRDVKNVHEELTTLEALGVIRFEEAGRAKRPVFPYDELVVTPLAHGRGDGSPGAP
jgi:predicted transcriptional regulator